MTRPYVKTARRIAFRGREEVIPVRCSKCDKPVENRTRNRKDAVCPDCNHEAKNARARAKYIPKKK
jgi:Zn finger protein HypA/HybF involved in hydrogenase expression